MSLHMLTTVDNPFDPFTQFDEWNAYDMAAGYNSLAFLGRVAKTSVEMSQADQDQEMESAIDEIVNENVNGLYRKVEISNTNSSQSQAV